MSQREMSTLIRLFENKTGLNVVATNDRGAVVRCGTKVDGWTWQAMQEAV